MCQKKLAKLVLVILVLSVFGCQKTPFDKQAVAPATLRDVPALKLNFRFEPDSPAPTETIQPVASEEKNASVQTDFDTNRAQEILEKTLLSPDKQRVLAVYRKIEDAPSDYRMDVYAPDGKLVRKVTPNGMAVRFPDTIVWSPDSSNVALVATTRAGQAAVLPDAAAAATGQQTPPSAATPAAGGGAGGAAPTDSNLNANTAAPPPPGADQNANIDPNAAANLNQPPAASAPTPEPPKPVLTFRTEQLYICNREGLDLKPLTQNEGLIYFYFIWAPDSSALVSLAATWREWQVANLQADQRGEIFVPAGRPRLVERNGRERRLDDNVTTVQPVWSPDSAKVALAFDKEIRIYDAIGDGPTQAAIPLRNPLLISSKAYDDELRRKEQNPAASNANANINAGANAQLNANAPAAAVPVNPDVNTLPDENLLVSFNPIIELEWTDDQLLYVRTGFVREYKNSAENRHSYLRWHRLVFSPQPVALN